MKAQVLESILIAKSIMDKVGEAGAAGGQYQASANLILLQDALELIFHATLIELGVDEQKSTEHLSFDQLLGELKSHAIEVPKSGTLKALNKSRVIVKHYGQTADPASVAIYAEAARMAIDRVLTQVVSSDLQGVVSYRLLDEGEARQHLEQAYKLESEGKYWECLVEIRKAIFVEIERSYSVEAFKTAGEDKFGLALFFGPYGSKAPYYTKNAEWIADNVKDPFDYIRLDHERIKIDLIEWGVRTQDFWNVWRLTPSVYQPKDTQKWLVKREGKYLAEGANEDNCRYCRETTTNLLAKKQAHSRMARWLPNHPEHFTFVKILRDTPLLESADVGALSTNVLEEGFVIGLNAWVSGFDTGSEFAQVSQLLPSAGGYLHGYIAASDCEVIEQPSPLL